MRYFVGYAIYTINIMKSLLIELPKLNGSIANFENLKYMSFIVIEKHENTKINFQKFGIRLRS